VPIIKIIGHVCVDRNRSEHATYETAGSPAMFMTKIFNQLPNCNVAIIAPYGPDFIQHLSHVSIYPPQPNRKRTLVYENVITGNNRTQRALNREYTEPIPIDTDFSTALASADIIFIAPLLPNFSPEYLRRIKETAHWDALKILLPQGYFRRFDKDNTVRFRKFDEADAALDAVDVVVLSDQDYPDTIALATSWTANRNLLAIVTLGDKGAMIIDKTRARIIPTIPVPIEDIVDSVGSGDIFSAGFGYRYAETRDPTEAARFANGLARQCLFFTPENITIDFPILTRSLQR